MALLDPLSEPGRCELRVCCPHHPVRLVSVRLAGQIRALQALWPLADLRFIYNGSELSDRMTFESYGIRDGDTIVALPTNNSVCATSQWLSATRDYESFNESVQWMLDPKTSAEAARIRDLHFAHCEGRRGNCWKRHFSALGPESMCRGGGETVTKYESAQEPSTDALPMSWDDSQIHP
jgi:hypothetical protein